jgi:methyltransferase (TIGR00027 family)
MNQPTTAVRNVSDTARWVAYFRAKETERPDALFRDLFASRLAGEHGFGIANTLADGNKHEWAWVARTYLFDQFTAKAVRDGAGMVINLAAGLDARPYRMELPSTLQWVEIDFPEIVSYKEDVLANDKPRCQLQRIALDLSDESRRAEVFADLNGRATNIVVASEGLLIYFATEQVASLAKSLAAEKNFRSWVVDLASPGQLRLMQRTTGKQLSEAGAAFKFGPPEGATFFAPYGWEPKEIRGMLKTAAEFNRAPAELLSLLPEPKGPFINYPWTGVCMLGRR